MAKDRSNQSRNWWQKLGTIASVLAVVVSAVATSIIAWTTWRYWQTNRDVLVVLERQASVLEQQVTATTRPYLYLAETKTENAPLVPLRGDDAAKRRLVKIGLVFKNAGVVPAVGVVHAIAVEGGIPKPEKEEERLVAPGDDEPLILWASSPEGIPYTEDTIFHLWAWYRGLGQDEKHYYHETVRFDPDEMRDRHIVKIEAN